MTWAALILIGGILVGYVAGRIADAYDDEVGRYSYHPHRRALRTLGRTNPRRRNQP